MAQERAPVSDASVRRDAEAFHSRLVNAIEAGARKQVAGLFRYPLQIPVPGLAKPVYVKDAASMIRMYDLFFNAGMRCAIEQSQMPQQGQLRPAHVLLAADGVVSFDEGLVVAERTPTGFKITRMTVRLEAPARSRTPRAVTFESGRNDAQFTGRLAHDEVDAYVVTAKKGDLLQASIERFPGRALALKVVQHGTDRVINGAATEYARTWAAPISETGDYRVEIQRRRAYCDPDVTYLLTLTLR